MSDKKVKFIRVRGRIVPIKEKKQDNTRKIIIGSAMIATGSGATIGGSYLASEQLKKARIFRYQADIGGLNIQSSNSRTINLKDMRLMQKNDGRIVGMGGKPKFIQPDLFDDVNKQTAYKFSLDKRVGAYKKALRSKKILSGSHAFSHALVGLGVDKLVEATGIEQNVGTQYASELAGLATFAGTTAIGDNYFKKRAHGQSFRRGFAKDISKALKKVNVVKIGKILLRRKLGFKI